jgi:succinoglycan biosynthesis protein ExoO
VQNSTSPDVSVIVAAFNAEPFLTRAIESTVTQRGPHIEVIIVDDGSTDNTHEVASKLAEKDERIRLARLQTNSGPGAARNAGIDIARGEWICVLDADDALIQGRLQALLDLARRETLDVVADNFWFWDARTESATRAAFEQKESFRPVDILDYLRNSQASFESTDWGLLKPMFRRGFLQDKHLRYRPEARHGEDFLLMMDCLLEGAKFGLSRELGYLYTMRTSGISRTSVDYEGMIDQCRTLLRDQRSRNNPALTRLLRKRTIGIRCLAAYHNCYRLLALHAYEQIILELLWNVNLWRALLRYPSLGHELLGVLERKLQKTLRLPGNCRR